MIEIFSSLYLRLGLRVWVAGLVLGGLLWASPAAAQDAAPADAPPTGSVSGPPPGTDSSAPPGAGESDEPPADTRSPSAPGEDGSRSTPGEDGSTSAPAGAPASEAADPSASSAANGRVAPGGALDGEGSSTIEDSDYAVTLRSLEARVNELKEKVFKSKARLVLLRETVLNGVISGARARISHRNEMGSSFTLERASYSLDGEPLFNRTDDDGSLDGQTEIELFEGSIVPGTHNLSVLLVYRGNGYGVFTYLRDYVFKIRASYPFTAEEGKVVTVKAVAYEKGGITTDIQDRPSIRFETSVKQDVSAAPASSEGGESEP